MFVFSSPALAVDFQLPDYVLGKAKTELSPEVLAKPSVNLFSADAKIELQWTEDKLAAVQLTYYQGTDYEVLKQKASLLLQQLSSQFGAIGWVSPEADSSATQTLEQQLGLLDQVMKTAPETAANYKQSHLANSTLVLDFQPTPQPDNSRLHLQISYSSFASEYSMVMFIDDPKAEARTAVAIVNLEAF
jgi:hypothetical protein